MYNKKKKKFKSHLTAEVKEDAELSGDFLLHLRQKDIKC